MRSATSIGTNVEESIAVQSRKDFLSKINISLKEARETNYWLKILDQGGLVLEIDYSQYLLDILDIINILTKISKTTSNNL